MSKAERYEKEVKNDDIESLEFRLSSELRGKIRKLNHYPLYSPQWCEMAEICGRVATISDIELSLSASKSDGTLWETEEHALRNLTEGDELFVTRFITLISRTRPTNSLSSSLT